MSSERGNSLRTRAQKHKNRTAFRNDLHDKTPQQKRINNLYVSEVCQHCKDVIEWKIKYKKYKPLSQAKTCTRCQQRNIRKAYHVLCRGCALETRVCAKCLKSADDLEIEQPLPTPEEEIKLKVEMENLVKLFPERKRRVFVRYMEKGKKAEKFIANDTLSTVEDDHEKPNTEAQQNQRIPHSRAELMQKIEKLKLAADNADNESDFDSDLDSDS